MLILTWFACSTTAELTPESAGALAKEIAANPAGAEDAVEAAGTDAATFEAYLFTVAADADLTRRYLTARQH